MALPTQIFQLAEPEAAQELLPDRGYSAWVALALFLLALAAVFLVLRKRRRAGAADSSAARRAAYREAADVLDQLSARTPREAAVRCSLILRRYLAVAAEDPALFETHEEFVARHDALASLSPEAKQAASEGFGRLAALKYAPEEPGAEIAQVVTESRALLETLHHGFASR